MVSTTAAANNPTLPATLNQPLPRSQADWQQLLNQFSSWQGALRTLVLPIQQTPAENTAGVTPTNYSYPPSNLLRYGADPTGQVDSTTAINQWLSVATAAAVGATPAYALYAPAGMYLTSGGHTINAKQDIYGDGIQRTIFQHTSTSNILFSLPLYGTNQAAVEFGGNRFRDFSCVGQGPSNSSEVGFYVKNKTDIKWDHVEITGFGYGVQGARDNSANSCTQLSFIACRVLNCGYALWAPLAWNACVFMGGCWQGSIWSMVLYDASATIIQTNVETNSGANGAIFIAGCQGCLIAAPYVEGSATALSFLPVAAFVVISSTDVTNNASPGGIALQSTYANRVQSGTFTSGTGVAYAVLLNGCRACAVESIVAGSGMANGVVYLTSSTTGNYLGVNWSSHGINAFYQTPTDQANNFEMSMSSGVTHLGIIDTSSIYIDEGNTSTTAEVAINKVGYQGGQTVTRRCTIYDGKGNALFQVDGANAQINLAAAKVFASSLPTTNPGAGSGQLWVNGGVVTRA